jgi:hypothetical protein
MAHRLVVSLTPRLFARIEQVDHRRDPLFERIGRRHLGGGCARVATW